MTVLDADLNVKSCQQPFGIIAALGDGLQVGTDAARDDIATVKLFAEGFQLGKVAVGQGWRARSNRGNFGFPESQRSQVGAR